MADILQKILKNEITYYVIVPIFILIIGWIKNGHDVRIKNRKMGYWKIKYKRAYSFYDIAIKIYMYMMINMFVMQVVRGGISFWIEEKPSYISTGIIYIAINIVILFFIAKRPKTKMELWTNKQAKQVLMGTLWFIFSMAFFITLVPKYQYVVESVYCISLIGWYFFLFKYADMIWILEKSYADIYINGMETVEHIYVGNMRKKGGWIYVDKYVEGYEKEIRIKESEIIRIDYYGEPIIYAKVHRTKRKKGYVRD